MSASFQIFSNLTITHHATIHATYWQRRKIKDKKEVI
jgi:hypothetical protein